MESNNNTPCVSAYSDYSEKKRANYGCINALQDLPFLKESTNDLYEFCSIFEKWHNAILLKSFKFFGVEFGNEKDLKEPFVIVEFLGVFDNLKSFSRRVLNEINSRLDRKNHSENEISVSVMLRGDELTFSVRTNSEIIDISATFLPTNQESVFHGQNDVVKFSLPRN